MTNSRAVHIVIPFYEGHDFIHTCVKSIRQEGGNYQVWIIDNDPKGISREQTAGRSINVLRVRTGIGYGRAANIGSWHALEQGASTVIVTNQDVVFAPGSISSLIENMDSSKLVVNTPMLYDHDLKSMSSFFDHTILKKTTYHQDVQRGEPRKMYESENAYGACFAFGRELWNTVGLFDPLYHMYGEDSDLFERVRLHGGTIRVVTDSQVGHFHTHIHGEATQIAKIRLWQEEGRLRHRIRFDTPSDTQVFKYVARRTAKWLTSDGFMSSIRVFGALRNIMKESNTLRNTQVEAINARIQAAMQQDKRPH